MIAGNHSIVINGNGFTRGRKASDILCKFKFNASFNHSMFVVFVSWCSTNLPCD